MKLMQVTHLDAGSKHVWEWRVDAGLAGAASLLYDR